jgi:hypothetical protein
MVAISQRSPLRNPQRILFADLYPLQTMGTETRFDAQIEVLGTSLSLTAASKVSRPNMLRFSSVASSATHTP